MKRLVKGTVFRNMWAGYESYFVYESCSKIGKEDVATGYGLIRLNENDNWKLDRNIMYYKNDLYDNIHFPIVGNINIDKLIMDALLSIIDVEKNKETT